MKRGLAAVFVCALNALILSCGASQGRHGGDDDFEPNPDDCHNLKDNGNPWVVEFPGADRASLRADIEAGVLLVKYDECGDFKLLLQCVLGEKYGTRISGGRETDKVFMHSLMHKVHSVFTNQQSIS